MLKKKSPFSIKEFRCRAPRKQRRLSAAFNCSNPGFVGNGKLMTLSICIDFNCKIRSSGGLRQISGSLNSSKSLLNTAEEYNLKMKRKKNG